MKKFFATLIVFLVIPVTIALAGEPSIREGIYQAKTPNDEPITVSIVKDKDGTPRIAYVGYDFVASLSVDKVLMKSGIPFGKMAKNKLIFQFPVMLSFSPSTSLSGSGGKVGIAYFKGQISPTETGDLSCVLTQIDALDKEHDGKFTMRDIGLASPPKDAKLEKKYKLTLKSQDKK